MTKHKKIICLDFDGVIHSYTSGWKGPRNIPDDPVKGAFEWIEKFIWERCTLPESMDPWPADGDYELCIYSSRSTTFAGRWAMKQWMIKHGFDSRYFEVIKFPTKKPPAHLTIDDRAICFKGKFPTIKTIEEFKPWNKK